MTDTKTKKETVVDKIDKGLKSGVNAFDDFFRSIMGLEKRKEADKK